MYVMHACCCFSILVQTCKVPKSHAAADLLRFFLKKSFFIIIKALKNIADFYSNTYTCYKLFSFQSNLHLRLQTGFYSKICTVVLLQINFHPVLYYSTKNQAYVLCILTIQYIHKCTFCIKKASMAYYLPTSTVGFDC